MCLYVSMWIDPKIKCISYYTNTTLIKCVFLSLQKLWHLQNTGGGLYFYMKSFLGSLSLIKILALNIFFIFELFYFWKNVYNLKVWLIFKRVYNLILSKWHFDSAHCFVFSSGFPVFSPSILHSICSAAWQNAIIQISVYPNTQSSKQMFSTSHCAIKLYKI